MSTRLNTILAALKTIIEALTPATEATITFKFSLEPWTPAQAQNSDYERKCWFETRGSAGMGEWFEGATSRDLHPLVDLIVGFRPDRTRRNIDLETKITQDIEQLIQALDNPTNTGTAYEISCQGFAIAGRDATQVTARITFRVHYSLAFGL